MATKDRRSTDNQPKFEAVSDAVLGFIELGHTQRAAAALSGVTPEAVSAWLTKGKRAIAAGNHSDKYAKFVVKYTLARGQAQAKMENALFAAGIRGNVTAAIAWLRARASDDWSEKATVRVEGGVVHDLSGKTDSELRQMMVEAVEQAKGFMVQ